MPPMLMNQEPISVQFYCSLGMLGWKMFDIWRTWPNIAFLSTLLLSSDWGFDYFWLKKKKKDRNKLCKCTQRCTNCLYILLLVHCCCRRQWWWFIFSFNVIYDYIWIYEYKQSIGLQRKSTWGCYFFLFVLNIFLGFFFFCCHHVKCICVLISFLLKKKKMLNVFQKCNGVDGVAQHRILKRNRQDITRSEIEKATTKTHCLYNPVHTDFWLWKWELKRYSIPYWSFGCLQTTQTCVGAFIPLYFCGDWFCSWESFCRGDFNGMTSDPSFACGYERCLYNLLTETNLDRWNTSYGITSKISSCTFILRTGCF